MRVNLGISTYATADRPDPAQNANALIYNTDGQIYQWSNGTNWIDFASAIVAPNITSCSTPPPANLLTSSQVSLFGVGFIGVSTVQLGGTSCPYTVLSSSEIQVTIPISLAGYSGLGFMVFAQLGASNSFGTYSVSNPPIVPTTYEALCISDGATLLYAFSQGNYNINTVEPNIVTPNTPTVTVNGQPTSNTPGIVKDCPHVAHGSNFNDYVNSPSPISIVAGADATLELVMTFDHYPGSGSPLTTTNIDDFGDATHGAPYARFEPDGGGFAKLVFCPSGSSNIDTPSNTVSVSGLLVATRYHVHCIWRSGAGTAEIWVNGVLAAGPTVVSPYVVSQFGMFYGYLDQWDGKAQELAFYPVALSSGQVAAHYAAGLP